MQQVNLYLDEFRRIEPEMSASMILIINGYVVGIALIFSISLFVLNQIQSNKQVALKHQVLHWEGQVENARKEFPEPMVDQQYIDEIDSLEEREKKNRSVLKYLEKNDVNNVQTKFSTYLKGLTQVDSKELWLTQVIIKNSGKALVLKGNAMNSDAVPEYINELSKVNALNRIQFEKIDFERIGKYIQFTIDSEFEEVSIENLLENASSQN